MSDYLKPGENWRHDVKIEHSNDPRQNIDILEGAVSQGYHRDFGNADRNIFEVIWTTLIGKKPEPRGELVGYYKGVNEDGEFVTGGAVVNDQTRGPNLPYLSHVHGKSDYYFKRHMGGLSDVWLHLKARFIFQFADTFSSRDYATKLEKDFGKKHREVVFIHYDKSQEDLSNILSDPHLYEQVVDMRGQQPDNIEFFVETQDGTSTKMTLPDMISMVNRDREKESE